MSTKKEFYIAGVQFHELPKIIDKISVGDHLNLKPEPTNTHDPNAVAIEYQDPNYEDSDPVMCGYVPKLLSAEITAMIELEMKLECVVTEVNPSARPWNMCKVAIQEVGEESEEPEGEVEEEEPDLDNDEEEN